jgi:hypothetical protein
LQEKSQEDQDELAESKVLVSHLQYENQRQFNQLANESQAKDQMIRDLDSKVQVQEQTI